VKPDIGKRRDEIAELGADFDRMAERLENLLAAQRQLLRDVSHELRSPLARLQVALGLARRRSQGARAELDRIEREAQRLDELIGQLLSLMRLESGTDIPAAEPLELAELLHSVAQDANFETENHQRRVAVTDAVPTTLLGDSRLLRSALENLVRNAMRHTAENTTVELSLRPDPQAGHGVVLRVRDYGPGVPEPDLPRLFDPFFRVEAARERGSGGYGLGLAIAARAVRNHGGVIEARNVEGGGLEVRVRLPV
jgi:two-component system sensor histidine kinase CpxA